eukprot:403362186
MYGQTFQLTFKGDKQYKTKLGGLISTIVLFSIIGFAIYKINIMMKKLDSKTSRNTIIQQQYYDPEIISLSDNGFDIAFTTSQPLYPNYGEIQVYFDNQTRVYDEATQKIVTTMIPTRLELNKCGLNGFLYDDLTEVKFKGIDNYMCIKDKSYLKTGGAFQSNKYQYVRVYLVPCQNLTFIPTENASSCVSIEDQAKFFNSIDFQTRYVNQFFDSRDFDKPIKSYIEDRLYFPLEFHTKKGADMFIKRNIAILQDSLLPFDPIQNLTFLQTEKISYFTADKMRRGYSILHLNIRLDFQFDIYERSIYSFSSLLSDIGGIYNALFLFGFILATHAASKVFYSRLIKEIYQAAESRQESERKMSKKMLDQKLNSKLFDLSQSSRQLNQKESSERKLENNVSVEDLDKSSNISFSLIKNIRKNSKNKVSDSIFRIDSNQLNLGSEIQIENSLINDLDSQKRDFIPTQQNNVETEEKKELKKSNIDKMLFEIQSRMNFKYSFCDIMRSVFCCGKSILSNKSNNQRRHLLYKKATKKINKEFDAVNLLKIMKQVKLISQLILNPTQKVLMGFQKKYVLDSEVSSDSDIDEKEVQGTIKKLRSENPFVKLVTMGQLKQTLKNYTNSSARNVNTIDKRLLYGILHKKYSKRKQIIEKKESKRLELNDIMTSIVASPVNEQETQYKYFNRSKSSLIKQKNKHKIAILENTRSLSRDNVLEFSSFRKPLKSTKKVFAKDILN